MRLKELRFHFFVFLLFSHGMHFIYGDIFVAIVSITAYFEYFSVDGLCAFVVNQLKHRAWTLAIFEGSSCNRFFQFRQSRQTNIAWL